MIAQLLKKCIGGVKIHPHIIKSAQYGQEV